MEEIGVNCSKDDTCSGLSQDFMSGVMLKVLCSGCGRWGGGGGY